MAEKTEHEVWRRQTSNKIPVDETHREVGGHRVSGAVWPDFDWRTHGVLWGVMFHRYVPRNPTMRRKNGKPDRLILEDLMREGRKRCEEAIFTGRPNPVEQPRVQDVVQPDA